MIDMIINIAKEFSPFPGGRFVSDGPYSGEKFRDEFLLPNISKEEKIVVVLDGAMGFGSSFLEEAFGGLVRLLKGDKKVLDKIDFVSIEDPFVVEEIRSYMIDATKNVE